MAVLRRLVPLLGLCPLLAAGSTGAGALLDAHELRGWDVLDEAPVDVSADPDLVRWGVVAQDARHYTREHRGRIQVCSVELWRFASESQAAAAAGGFAFPDWRIDRVGTALVMLRGLVRDRDGRSPERGVFDECDAIGARIRARAGEPTRSTR